MDDENVPNEHDVSQFKNCISQLSTNENSDLNIDAQNSKVSDTFYTNADNEICLGKETEKNIENYQMNCNKNVESASSSIKIQPNDASALHSETEKIKDHSYIISKDKYFNNPEESAKVFINCECGIQLEFAFVPINYCASDIAVILVGITGLKHDSFALVHNRKVVRPLTPLSTLVDENRLIRFQLKMPNQEETKKIKLGTQELTLKSGLTIKIVGRKVFVSEDMCSQENKMVVKKVQNGKFVQEYVDIKWLPPEHHKPFLGGYKDTRNNLLYHNASAQTRPPPPKIPESPRFSRDSQTYKMRHFGQTTVNQMSTQFSMPGFFVSNSQDRVLSPGPYETADEYHARILEKIIIIQKYIRRWLAKKRVEKLKKIRREYNEWEKQHKQEYQVKREEQLKRDLERRLYPKTSADFDRLFNALELWRTQEVGKIEEKKLNLAEKKALLALLLEDETELIASITRHQICAAKKQQEKSQIQLFRKAAAPHRWISALDGRPIKVATKETLRGKELLEIFQTLCLDCLTEEERMDIILTVKQTVCEYNTKLTKEIIELVDREAELIIRGIPNDQLIGLRQRIRNRFALFAKSPEVNPSIANYLVVPTGRKETAIPLLKGDLYYCLSCGCYLKGKKFPLSTRSNRFAPCESCRRQDNRARNRFDLKPYEHILHELRYNEIRLMEKIRIKSIEDTKELLIQKLEKGEQFKPDFKTIMDEINDKSVNINPFPFLVNKEDIRFLIDEVWERRSVLSGWLDITDLTLIRWKTNEPWSPWNTMLVTHEEAETHNGLGELDVEKAYADALLNIINQRLVMGKNSFKKLTNIGIKMFNEQIEKNERMKIPQNTSDWLKERRQKLPPLALNPYTDSTDLRHKATYQISDEFLPAIKGEKRWSQIKQENKAI